MIKSDTISEEEMNIQTESSSNKHRSRLREGQYLKKTSQNRYEIIDGEEYDVHYDYDEEECAQGTAQTQRIVHAVDRENNNSFWLSLCSSHREDLENDVDFDVLETREPKGEST